MDASHPQSARALRAALRFAQIPSYPLRRYFGTDLPKSCLEIRTIRSLLGHAEVSTTILYLLVMKRAGLGAPSPLDLE